MRTLVEEGKMLVVVGRVRIVMLKGEARRAVRIGLPRLPLAWVVELM